MLAQYVLDAYFEGKSAMPVEQTVSDSRRSGAA
jgi:hypothetical protein